MSIATMTLGWRPRPRLGPALRRFQLPYFSLAVSAGVHVVLAVALVLAAAWRVSTPKPYFVTLAPAVAAVGLPQGRSTLSLPPRATEPLPSTSKTETEPSSPPASPAPLPPRARESAGLPDRGLPPRAAALPRAGEKELPSMSSGAAAKAPPAPATTPAAPPPPAAPLGSVTGTAQGSGAVTLSVSDFPYALYLRQLTAKIQEQWEGKGIPGRQPEIVFEISRDGQLRRLVVGKTSGNTAYDQVALRAVNNANPFPPLPEAFPKPTLTVGLQFVYDPSMR